MSKKNFIEGMERQEIIKHFEELVKRIEEIEERLRRLEDEHLMIVRVNQT
jgi:Mg2+ and Co2+ transporter CorA